MMQKALGFVLCNYYEEALVALHQKCQATGDAPALESNSKEGDIHKILMARHYEDVIWPLELQICQLEKEAHAINMLICGCDPLQERCQNLLAFGR